MELKKLTNVDEKNITRSYFKDDKETLPSKRSSSKLSSKNNTKKLAEVFRTDFITAMKIPDSQQLTSKEYILLKDTWRQEWEKGVQVPVAPDKLKASKTRVKYNELPYVNKEPFCLPTEMIRFNQEKYNISIDRSCTACNYDLDDVDTYWLNSVHQFRTLKKAEHIDEITMERAITYFERKCFEKMAHAVATKEGLSIEYDENTTCNVCLNPDAEDGNEIIFCDACNMCAHQHCYGVPDIPEGNWLCNPCSRGILSPPCCLCPKKGGAMKRIKDSYEWIHVICAWWIPEVKIEDTKYIERITKDKIPPSRWNLPCSICHDKMGACIQCSVKRCVRAYHVTCAVKEGLEMKTVVIPQKDDVQHVSFCSKHCTPVPPEENPNRKKSGEDVENNRLRELRKLESEFHSLVSVTKAARDLKLAKEVARRLHGYWTMKRRSNGNAPLIKLTLEQQEQLSGKQGVVFINQQRTLEMERFLHLRQDLERLRNLCYMIVRREKMRKEIHRTSVDMFYKQNDILLDQIEKNNSTEVPEMKLEGARFCRFSSAYRTERQLEEETGEKVRMFDDTKEEEATFLDSSQFEVLNPKDLERPSPVKKKNKPKNGEVEKETSERNIFELLEPEKKIDIYLKTDTTEDEASDRELNEALEMKWNGRVTRSGRSSRLSTPIKEMSDSSILPVLITEDCVKSLNSLKEKLRAEKKDPIKQENTIDVKNKSTFENGYLDLFKSFKNESPAVSYELNNLPKDISNSPLPNSSPSRSSGFVKRGKKRFRNLHDGPDREVRRQSPRFRPVQVRLLSTDEDKGENSNKDIEQEKNENTSNSEIEKCNSLAEEKGTENLKIDSNDISNGKLNKMEKLKEIMKISTTNNEPDQRKNLDINKAFDKNEINVKRIEECLSPNRKRRRLSSAAMCSSAVKLKQENFMRITRSRLSSYS